MIYVLGMSHAINVLKAASREPLSLTHENWSALTSGGRFFDVPVKRELMPDQDLQAFIVSRATNWGSMAEMQLGKEGQYHVVAVDGYVDLLLSLAEKQEQGVLFSFVHGNEHSMLSMVQHARPYDFFVPWSDEETLAPGTQPVSFALIRKQMERALNPTIAALAMMRNKLPRMRLVHVMPPPPIESEERILHTPEVFRERIAQTGVTPLSIRLKYYALAGRMLAAALKPFNIELLECPLESVGPSGAIKDEYAYGATHGNEAYGELVLKQLYEAMNKHQHQHPN